MAEIEEEIIVGPLDHCGEISKQLVKRFPCSICHYKSTTSSNLNTHKKSQHGYVKEKQTSGKYQCDKCDHKATQKGNLRSHQKMKHEGVTFPCSFCNHKSGSTGNLMEHVKCKHT